MTSESPEIATAKPPSKGSVKLVMLVIFLDLLGFGIVLPMVPYIAEQPHFAPDPWIVNTLEALSLSGGGQAVIVGLLSFCYSFCQFVMAPVWGRLSDRVGRRPVLIVSMAGYAFAWALFAFAPDLNWLLVSRIFAGITAANIATAQAYMADVFPPEKRSKGMGLVGAAFGLGFTLGPPIGAGLMTLGRKLQDDDLGIALPIYFAMALSVLALVFA
ncbi:MAG: MFS transporter, partial [Planctomycetes bacterium]|nr:MFS transporter [Planctomycetota bacterium]